MLVKAIAKGFIYCSNKKEGDTFELVDLELKDKSVYKAKDQFSEKWMVEISQPKKANKNK